jgi:hypothetical protein
LVISTIKLTCFCCFEQDILSKKKESVLVRQNKLSKGVSKLQEAKKVVHHLKTEAVSFLYTVKMQKDCHLVAASRTLRVL